MQELKEFFKNLIIFTWIFAFLLNAFFLFIYGLHRLFLVYLHFTQKKNKPVPKKKFSNLPKVTVQLPVFNELYVCKRIYEAVSKLDYPKNLLQIQILDDSTDETLKISQKWQKKMTTMGLDVQLLHRTDRSGFKAGALENGLKSAKGDFILIFDADFVPQKKLIHKLIHFFTDQKIAMVQARWGHLNRGDSILTQLQALVIDAHMSLEQQTRFAHNRFFHFNGTGGMWRKTAIKDAGGWQHDTLTEDMDLSFRALLKGWKFIFLKDVIVPAELPTNIFAYKTQQFRWAKGTTQTFHKLIIPILKSKYPFKVKLEAAFAIGNYYLSFITFSLCIFFLPLAFTNYFFNIYNKHLIVAFMAMLFTTLSFLTFYFSSDSEFFKRKLFIKFLLMPFILSFGVGMCVNNGIGIIEAIFKKKSIFERTPKYGKIKKSAKKMRKNYLTKSKNIIIFLEIFLAIFYASIIIYHSYLHIWGSVYVFSYSFVGFAYLSYLTIRNFLQRKNAIL